MSDEGTMQISLRAPIDYVERADGLAERMPAPAGATASTRSTVLRLALELGLKALEQQYPAPTRSKR